jgi:hypothetical protein
VELILRWLNARTFAATGALVVAVWAWRAIDPWSAVDARLHPPQGPATGAGDIAADLDRQESARLRALHARVTREVAEAAAKGRPVGRLQSLADAALKLDAPGTRRLAVEKLNKLRLAIPRSMETFRPAGADEGEEEVAVPRSRAKPRKGKRR